MVGRMDGWTDRQTDIGTVAQTHERIFTRNGKQINERVDKRTNGQIIGRTNKNADGTAGRIYGIGVMNGWPDGWMDGQTDGWMDGQTNG